MDRLSALPDDLLIRILFRPGLGLSLKEAARTCLLSKRWRFVWTDLPSLFFTETTGQIEAVKRFKSGVDGALGSRRGAALERLSLFFCYDESMASDVDAWVESAAKNKVQNLNLSLIKESGDHYSVHRTVYSNSWLKRLSMKGCAMAAAAVEWRSMTEISLRYCILPQQLMDNIGSSGCPALSRLRLKGCGGFDRLEIGGKSFRSLKLEFHQDSNPLLEVSAPYMTDLEYAGDPAKRTLRLTNVVSLRKVDLLLVVSHSDDQDPFSLPSIITNAYQIFDTIRCANLLVLRYDALKVLSMMATHGCQLPQFKVEDMTLFFNSHVLNTHATILILESSPFLETLTIHGSQYGEGYIESDPLIRHNLNYDLLHLKSVKFYVNIDKECSCKSSFTLAHTILERAPILEEMDICKFKSNFFAPLKDFIGKFETLSSFPKSSHKARIVIS